MIVRGANTVRMWERISLRGQQNRLVRDKEPRPHEADEWREIRVPRGRQSKRCWFLQYFEDEKWQIGGQEAFPRTEPLFSLEEMVAVESDHQKFRYYTENRRWFNIDTGIFIPSGMLISGR